MTKKEILELKITTWWWNMGHKKKDFEGTYKEWFEKNNIHIHVGLKRIYFSGAYGSLSFKIDTSKDFVYGFNFIIQMCLTWMGDKALLRDGYGRVYAINWR